ncbi:MAG: tetratricopeptide repeat protein [Acidobacteriota bacterium]
MVAGTAAIARPRATIWLVPVIAVVIVAAGTWAYATSFDGVFVLDDVRAIARNPTIRTLWPLSAPLAPPTASTVAGRPVANLSLAINYALAPPEVRNVFETNGPGSRPGAPDTAARLRRNARGYHAGNLLIHLAAALVLFGIVRRTLLSERLRSHFEHSALWMAGAIALVWVTHPLTSAAVTYIVQRVESLMGLLFLLTLYCAIRASEGKRAQTWTAAAIASCGLGMATKETMVSAPVVVAAWMWLFTRVRRLGTARDRRSHPAVLFAGLAATWVILALLVLGERRGPSLSLAAPTAWRYLLTQSDVVVHYLGQAFVPTSLVFLYDWPLAETLSYVWPQALVLSALVVVTAAGVIRRWPVAFLGVWFFLILAPSSSVLPIVTEVAAEHRMYLPLAAVVALIVLSAVVAARRLNVGGRMGAVAALAATVVVVAAAAVETRARNEAYWSSETLWRDTVAKRPDFPRPRVLYGSVLLSAGKVAEAEAQLRVAVTLAPDDPMARLRLGAALAQQRKFDEAIPHVERAAANLPDDPGAYRMLGEIYAAQGQDALAVANLERALSGMGGDPDLLVRLAMMLADSRDPSVRDGGKALGLAERAVALTSRRHVMALAALALAQAESGRVPQAAGTAREALQLAREQNANPALIRELEYRVQHYTR